MKNCDFIVVGDIILDKYLFTQLKRISPEAPVPVCDVLSETERLGGAANVASNIKNSTGAVSLIGAIADDKSGEDLQKLLRNSEIDVIPVLDKNGITTVKTRIISQNQQLLRVDKETQIGDKISKRVLDAFRKKVQSNSICIFSDYRKGNLIYVKEMLNACRKNGCISIVDPKSVDFSIYKNATVLKPNKRELCSALSINEADFFSSYEKIGLFRKELNIEHLVITLSQDGIIIFNDKYASGLHFPQEEIVLSDVTGAGDSVSAALAIGFSLSLEIESICKIANKIGKKAVQHLGNYTLDKEDLKLFEVNDTFTLKFQGKIKNKEKKRKKVFTNGCFDIIHAGHVDYLKRCKEFGQELIVGLNSDRSVTKLKGSARPINNFEHRKAVLIALEYVDKVIEFDEETPKKLIHKLKPDVLIKGGDYKVSEIVGYEYVKSYGGVVVTIPFNYETSTSKLIAQIKYS